MKKIKQAHSAAPIEFVPNRSQVDSALARRDAQELQQIMDAAQAGLERIEPCRRGFYVENLTVNIYNDSFNDNSTTETSTPNGEADALKGLGFFLLFFGFSVMILGFSVSHQQPVIVQPVEVNHAKS